MMGDVRAIGLGFSIMELAARLRGGAFTPASLFASGESGAWDDPSDLSTLWQDTGGTVAVTLDGQSVARMDDKSGNGHHFTQATASLRPVYKTSGGLHWLQFDGVDDILAVGTTALDSPTATMAACMKLRVAGGGVYRTGWVLRKQILYANLGIANTWGSYNGAEVPSSYGLASNTVVVKRSRAFDDVDLFTNGNAVETVTTGTTYNDRGLFLGADSGGAQPGAIDFYGGISRLSVLSDSEVSDIKEYLADKGGVTL